MTVRLLKTIETELLNITKGAVIAGKLSFALKHNERRKGLIGRRDMQDNEAIIFPGCRQIHTFGMLFLIDAVFIDYEGTVKKVYRDLSPGRIAGIALGRRTAVELKAGTLERTNTMPGDQLRLDNKTGGIFSVKDVNRICKRGLIS